MPVQPSNEKANIKIRGTKLCARCGRPAGRQAVSSLTSWLFQETFCQCNLREKSEVLAVPSSGSLFDSSAPSVLLPLPDIGEEFEVLECLGKGGMGTVYKVRNKSLDQVFAVKLLHSELQQDAQSLNRFEQEARAALLLNHPNLVRVYAYGTSPSGAPYLVMDYIDGEPLSDRLMRDTYLDIDFAIEIFTQICDSLTHAHQHGLIHRDIKPGNIIITSNSDGPIARLVDFGIAKMRGVAGRETQNLTQTGDIFGSPQYMSPEQCLGFDLDSRSDIYSLGCVMYECLSGKPPFDGHNAVQLIAKHLGSQPPPLRICDLSTESEVGKNLTLIIQKCLSKEPSERFFSAELLGKELDYLKDSLTGLEKTQQSFRNSLSWKRSAFVLLCLSSVATVFFAFIKDYSANYMFLPMLSAVVGMTLLLERQREIMTRSQFQLKASSESAFERIRILFACGCLIAVLTVTAAFFAFSVITLPNSQLMFSTALLGCLIGVSVLIGTNLSSDDSDFGLNTALSGTYVAAVAAFSVTAFAAIFIFNTGLKVSESKDKTGSNGVAFEPLPRLVNSSSISADFTTATAKLSSVMVIGERKMRVFTLPPNVLFGTIRSAHNGQFSSFPAQGTFQVPVDARLELELNDQFVNINAPLLKRFDGTEFAGVRFKSRSLEGASLVNDIEIPGFSVDDAVYFVSAWKGLRKVDLFATTLTDRGLAQLQNSPAISSLNVNDSEVTAKGISKLSRLRELLTLRACGIPNRVRILEALKGSDKLNILGISAPNFGPQDLQLILTLKNLKSLELNGFFKESAVKATSIPYLSKLTNLKELYLRADHWSESDIKKLTLALPKCRVVVMNNGSPR